MEPLLTPVDLQNGSVDNDDFIRCYFRSSPVQPPLDDRGYNLNTLSMAEFVDQISTNVGRTMILYRERETREGPTVD